MYSKLIISKNKLTLPDGRILARYVPDFNEWEVLKWYKSRYMGCFYVPDNFDGYHVIFDFALREGLWVSCTECEEAKEYCNV